MTNPPQSPTDAELVREARKAASNTVYSHLDYLFSQLADRIEALSASRREYGEFAWQRGFWFPNDSPWEERMHADLDALEREGK